MVGMPEETIIYLESFPSIVIELGVVCFLTFLAFSIKLFIFKNFHDFLLKFLKNVLNRKSENI